MWCSCCRLWSSSVWLMSLLLPGLAAAVWFCLLSVCSLPPDVGHMCLLLPGPPAVLPLSGSWSLVHAAVVACSLLVAFSPPVSLWSCLQWSTISDMSLILHLCFVSGLLAVRPYPKLFLAYAGSLICCLTRFHRCKKFEDYERFFVANFKCASSYITSELVIGIGQNHFRTSSNMFFYNEAWHSNGSLKKFLAFFFTKEDRF